MGIPDKEDEIDRLLARYRQQAEQRERLAARLEAKGRPVRMIDRDGRKALAQADMAEPGQYRITWFIDKMPIGHCNFNRLRDAIIEGLRAGYTPQETA
jgi:hypothetical protein